MVDLVALALDGNVDWTGFFALLLYPDNSEMKEDITYQRGFAPLNPPGKEIRKTGSLRGCPSKQSVQVFYFWLLNNQRKELSYEPTTF